MRLINTETLELEEFIGSQTPSYAILSHTWGNEEVSLQDWYNMRNSSSNISSREGYTRILDYFRAARELWHNTKDSSSNTSSKGGYTKILDCCKIAREDGHHHVWVDTCCIDKTSSAELTESINSMFRWYKQAEVCYVYLIDFDVSASSFRDGAKGCRWFTRGWTLQELIAPADVLFYDMDWQFRGKRMEHYQELVNITGIDSYILRSITSPYEYSVAARMSWAALRQTTRTEDNAYCLLGLFDVNMPLIYGEGVGAFRRLQEAIIKNTNDLSILAWGISPKTVDVDTEAAGLVIHRPSEDRQIQDQQVFATSPSDFVHSKGVCKLPFYDSNPEFATTNKGLRVEANLVQFDHRMGLLVPAYFLELADRMAYQRFPTRILLKLRMISTDVYASEGLVEADRNPRWGLSNMSGKTGLRSFYISYEPPQNDLMDIFRFPTGVIHIPEFDRIQLLKTIPEDQWNETKRESFEPTEESAQLVLAAYFEAHIQYRTMEFIVIFDTVTDKGLKKMLCRVLDCRKYRWLSDWMLNDRGSCCEILWPDLISQVPEVMQLGDRLHVDVQGTMVGFRVTLHDNFSKDVKMAIETLEADRYFRRYGIYG